jgi:DNA invertase Pin-like site-specific DNA recombinase
MGIIGYARVSTQGQELDLQLDALRAAGCERIFEDRGVSGAKAARPGLDDLVRYVREGDVLTVYKLDRLGRNVSHLLAFVEELSKRKVGFRSLTEQLDTTTPGGRPRSVTPEKLARAKELMADRKLTTPEIARRLKVSKSALYDALAESKSASSSDAPLPIAAM